MTAEETNAEHAEFCRELATAAAACTTRGRSRLIAFAPRVRPRTTLLFPGSIGGANWGGTAADPALGLGVRQHDGRGRDRLDRGITPGHGRSANIAVIGGTSAVGGPLAHFWWSDGWSRLGR